MSLHIKINKYNINLNIFIESKNNVYDTAINENGSHITISKVAESLIKNTTIFDESNDLWFC